MKGQHLTWPEVEVAHRPLDLSPIRSALVAAQPVDATGLHATAVQIPVDAPRGNRLSENQVELDPVVRCRALAPHHAEARSFAPLPTRSRHELALDRDHLTEAVTELGQDAA